MQRNKMHVIAASNQDLEVENPVYSIQEPLSENDIFTLQDIFLTNGIQEIQVPTLTVGRKLMSSFLKIAFLYHDIACLTMYETETLPSYVTDIGDDILLRDEMDTFLYEQFHFDFLWIEKSESLYKQERFKLFQKKIIDLDIPAMIPIIIVNYECEA